MKNVKENNKANAPEYISNPFRLAIDAAKRFYKTNKSWALVILAIGLFNTLSNSGDLNRSKEEMSFSLPSALSNPDATTIFALVIFVTGIAVLVIGLVILTGTYVQGILTYAALQSEKGNAVVFKDALNAVTKRFWRLFLAQVLATIKILGWSLLFIVPGIIAALRYSLLSYVIMDEPSNNKNVKESHDRVKSLTKKRLIEVLGISFTGIVPVVGMLFDLTGKAALYRQLQVYTDKKLEKPAKHWANYLALYALVIMALLLILLLVVAINYR